MNTYLRIVGWDRYQHYKDRNPPWIKLHRELLTSETWVLANNDSRVLAVACMLLAAATGNRIRADKHYIQRVAYLDTPPDWSELIELGFLELVEEQQQKNDASIALANARPETETETEELSTTPHIELKKQTPVLARARKTRLPEPFEPVLTVKAQAIATRIGPERYSREVQRFADHHRAKGSTMLDWQAAFRTWLSRCEDYDPGRRRRGYGDRPSGWLA